MPMKSTPRMPGLVDQRGEPIEEPPPQKQTKATPCQTTVADLQQVFTSARSTQLQQVADLVNQYGKDFGIDNAAKLQHFLTQAGGLGIRTNRKNTGA